MKHEDSQRTKSDSKSRLLPVLLIIVGALAYANSLGGPFIFDDKPNILENTNMRQLWPLSEAMSAPAASGITGRPILCLTLALNYAISEYSVWSYHVFNVVIHLLAGLALYGLVRRTLLSERLRERFGRHAALLAWAIATIWVVHPIQTESVTYIIQRCESLMGLFYLLTIYAAVLAAQTRRRAIWSVVSVICCGLGMGTKEVMVTAPVIVLLYDRTFVSGSLRSALQQRWGLYAGLAATWAVLVVSMWSCSYHGTVGFSAGVSAMDYAMNQCIVILHYLWLCIWPMKLCLYYNSPVVKEFAKILPSLVVIMSMVGVTAWGLVRNRNWAYLCACFLGILAPTSSFIPIEDLVFEHRLYLSSAALIAAVVTGAYMLLKKAARQLRGDEEPQAGAINSRPVRWFGVLLMIAVITALSLATIRRNADYRSAVSIWKTVVEVVPGNAKAHYNLGGALSAQNKLDEAIGHYRQALRIDPQYAKAHYNLGLSLSTQGKPDAAIEHYRQAVRIKPDYALAHNNLGNVLQGRGRFEEAIDSYRRAVQIEPELALAQTNLGALLQLQGKPDEAIECYRQALQVEPEHISALNNLTWILATCPQARVRDARLALELGERAAELTGHKDAGILDTLAAAYAESGDFLKAVEHENRAIELARGKANASAVSEYEKHLAVYKDNRPWRE